MQYETQPSRMNNPPLPGPEIYQLQTTSAMKPKAFLLPLEFATVFALNSKSEARSSYEDPLPAVARAISTTNGTNTLDHDKAYSTQHAPNSYLVDCDIEEHDLVTLSSWCDHEEGLQWWNCKITGGWLSGGRCVDDHICVDRLLDPNNPNGGSRAYCVRTASIFNLSKFLYDKLPSVPEPPSNATANQSSGIS